MSKNNARRGENNPVEGKEGAREQPNPHPEAPQREGTRASYQRSMITGVFPPSKGRTVMKPLFRLDPACSGALSGRILFEGRFSHGVAMG
jgi:hypothetical protein